MRARYRTSFQFCFSLFSGQFQTITRCCFFKEAATDSLLEFLWIWLAWNQKQLLTTLSQGRGLRRPRRKPRSMEKWTWCCQKPTSTRTYRIRRCGNWIRRHPTCTTVPTKQFMVSWNAVGKKIILVDEYPFFSMPKKTWKYCHTIRNKTHIFVQV